MAVVDSGRRTASGAIVWKAAPTSTQKTYTYTYRSGDKPPKSSDYSSYRDYSRASYAYSKNKRAVTIAKLKSGQSLSSSELRGAGIQSSGSGYRYYDSAAKKYVTTQPTAQILAEKKAAEAKKQQKELEAIKIATTKKEKDIMKLQYAMQQGWFSPGALKKSKKSQQEIMQGMPTVKEKKVAMDIGGQTFTGTYGITRTAPKQSEAVSLPLAQFKTKGKEELNILAPERTPGPQESSVPLAFPIQKDVGYRYDASLIQPITSKEIESGAFIAPSREQLLRESKEPSYSKSPILRIKFDMEEAKKINLKDVNISKVAEYRGKEVTWENVGDIEKALSESNVLLQKSLLADQTMPSLKQASDIRIGDEVLGKAISFKSKEYAKLGVTLAATTLGVGAAGQVLSSVSKVAVAGKLIKIGSPVLKGAWGISLVSRGKKQVEYIKEGQAERGLLGITSLGAEVGGVALAGKWLTATQGKPITSLYKQTIGKAYSRLRQPYFERDLLKWEKSITDPSWTYKERMGYLTLEGRPQRTLHGEPISKTKIKWLREGINQGFYGLDIARYQVMGYDTYAAQQHLTSTYVLKTKGFKLRRFKLPKPIKKVVKIIPHTDPTRAINVKAIDWMQGKGITISPKKMTSFGYSQMLDVEPSRFTFIQKYPIKAPLYERIKAKAIPSWPDTSIQSQLIKPAVTKYDRPFYLSKPKSIYVSKKQLIDLTGIKATPTKKLFVSHKHDKTALDRAALKGSSADVDVTPHLVQEQPAFTYSGFKTIPLWDLGTKERMKAESKGKSLQLDTVISKQESPTKIKPFVKLSISQIKKQEQIQKPVQILKPTLISFAGSSLRAEPIIKQTQKQVQMPQEKDEVITSLIETPPPIEESPPVIIVPSRLPLFAFSKKISMPGINFGLSFKPVKRGINIAPLSDLLSVNITEMFTGRKATHPSITEEEKLLFDTGIKRGRQHFPTMEMRAGKVKMPRITSIFGTTKRKHKKSRKKKDLLWDLL